MRHILFPAAAILTLAACGGSDPSLDQTGARPDLPDQRETLVPPMKIATPQGWGTERPIAPKGFTVTAFATGLAIPRQTLVLPNGDILVAEGSGGSAPVLRPKDMIAGYDQSLGKSSVKGGNRVTLRDWFQLSLKEGLTVSATRNSRPTCTRARSSASRT